METQERQRNGAIHESQEYLRIDPKGPADDQINDMIPKIQAAMKKVVIPAKAL
jgi:hypothetical protein